MVAADSDTGRESPEELEVEEEPVKCPVTDSDAACMFEKCLARLEQQPEANSYNTSTVVDHFKFWQVKSVPIMCRFSHRRML